MDSWGLVVDEDRGSLPFALIHGESLYAAAAFALEAAGSVLVAPGCDLDVLAEEECPLVLHDPLCPLTPPGFIAETIRRCDDSGAIVVGHRPVTDTVKTVENLDGLPRVGTTVDRDGLVEITSPIVLPPAVVAGLQTLPRGEFCELVADYRSRWPVLMVAAPALGRRVHEPADISILEAISAASR